MSLPGPLSGLADHARRHMSGLNQRLWDAFAPPRCAGCGIELTRRRACFCPPCERLADPVTSPACPTCLEPHPRPVGRAPKGIDLTCRRCRNAPPAFERLHARWLYRDSVSDALLAVKYGGELWRLRQLADESRGWARDAVPSDAPDIRVCPVPMFPSDLRDRGFNVSSLLARWWFDSVHRQVRKIRRTRPQAGLPRQQRRTNLDGAFEVIDPDTVRERRWIVVDDVATTATTARHIARLLREAGATTVWVVTLARAGQLD